MYSQKDHSEPERSRAFLDHCRNVARCHEGFAALMEEDDRDHIAYVGELLERRNELSRGVISMSGDPETEIAELAVAISAGLFERSTGHIPSQAGGMHLLLQALAGKTGAEILRLCDGIKAQPQTGEPLSADAPKRERAPTAQSEFRERAFVLGQFYGHLANFLDDARPVDIEFYGELFFDFQNALVCNDESPAPAALSVVAGIHEDKDRTPKEESLFAIASVAKQLSVEDLAAIAKEAQTRAEAGDDDKAVAS